MEDELQKLEDAIESFKTNETFDSMEADLIELEDLLDQLRKRPKRLCDMTMKKSEKCQSRSRLMTEKSNWSITNFKSEFGKCSSKIFK